MTTPGPDLTTADLRAELRASQDRDLRRVGVPVFLAARDETGAPAPDRPTDDGAAVAVELDRIRAALAPSQRDGDLGITTSLLAVAAYRDFGAPAEEDPS